MIKLETAISMEPIKEKLKKLPEIMPGHEQIIYDFGAFLADRLNPELVPQGFAMAAELALYDAQKGVDGFTGKPISGRLHGYPPQLYAVLRMYVPQIAKTVCPEDFAQKVENFQQQVNARTREKS